MSMKSLQENYTTFGEHLRGLREESGLSLREVAMELLMDTSLLAKIERNERPPSRLLIREVAIYFNVDERKLVNEFLSDQIANKVLDENVDVQVLKVAEAKISLYRAKRKKTP
jgi:transcriptional regulator with XRE-family HTH domain